MNLNELFAPRFFTASDFATERSFLIDSLKVLPVNTSGETKPVLRFRDVEQGLVLNRTNASVLADAFGEEADDWIGKPVILFRAKTEFQGKEVDCVRLRISEEIADEVSQAHAQTSTEAPF